MACYHPSKVLVSRKGLAGRVRDRVMVPCGHCLGCRTDQARGWAVRLVHEGVTLSPAWFVTLTYAPENLPENGTLVPRDITLFIKKLRRMLEGERISYYIAGEYGEVTARPHYHAVLYGPRLLDRIHLSSRHGAPVFRSPSLENLWGHGILEFTALTYAAARYCASYVRKKVRMRDDPEHYSRVDPGTGELLSVEREFGRMSRRPAIGRKWIERFWTDVYPRDFVVVDGRPLKPPRYYDKWMDKFHPDVMLSVRTQRYEDLEVLGDDKLIMMEKIHRARVNFFEGRSAI